MLKNKLFILSILPILVSSVCHANENIAINEKSKDHAIIDLVSPLNNSSSLDEITILSKNEDNVSHIYYDKFNVNPEGLTINNDVSSKLIINEVVSNNQTNLLGNLAIKGSMAKVIIANPNGIECIDCSFIGIDNIDLITGSSAGLYSKEFNLTDNGYITIKNSINAGTLKSKYESIIPINHYNLALFSNYIEHIEGSLNAADIFMFTGLKTAYLNNMKKNVYNNYGYIGLNGYNLNTSDLVMVGGYGDIEIADNYFL